MSSRMRRAGFRFLRNKQYSARNLSQCPAFSSRRHLEAVLIGVQPGKQILLFRSLPAWKRMLAAARVPHVRVAVARRVSRSRRSTSKSRQVSKAALGLPFVLYGCPKFLHLKWLLNECPPVLEDNLRMRVSG